MSVNARIVELRELIDVIDESIGEMLTQYYSECALYGDAGPGQNPSLWKVESDNEIQECKRELDKLYATPAGKLFLLAEEQQRQKIRKAIS
jgi:hypothetical protein